MQGEFFSLKKEAKVCGVAVALQESREQKPRMQAKLHMFESILLPTSMNTTITRKKAKVEAQKAALYELRQPCGKFKRRGTLSEIPRRD